MLDKKNFLSKYAKYLFGGFLLFIIAYSFAMPDLSSCGTAGSSVAVVNGEKIHPLEFLRFRDTKYSRFKNQKMDSLILDQYIMELLLIQKADKTGFRVTEERLSDFIRNSPQFRNPSTGKFDPNYFQAMLRASRMSLNEFEKILRRDLLLNDYRFFMNTGGAASSEDASFRNTIENSKIQIKYSFLSTDDIKNRYRKEISVSANDIETEIKSNNVKISDPVTDKERIRKELEEKRIEKIKNDLAAKINSVASSQGTFAAANSILNGKTATSAVFKIGEPAKTNDKAGKSISSINGSPVFIDKCLQLPEDKTSPAIIAPDGIYIFTPVLKNIAKGELNESDLKKYSDSSFYASSNMIARNLLKELNEKSKIIKNLKTD